MEKKTVIECNFVTFCEFSVNIPIGKYYATNFPEFRGKRKVLRIPDIEIIISITYNTKF